MTAQALHKTLTKQQMWVTKIRGRNSPPSRRKLMRAVVQERVASWSANASTNNLDESEDFKSRLVRHAETLAHALGDNEVRDFERPSRASSSRFPELAKMLHDIGYRYELEFLAEEIRKGTSLDAVPARNPELIARQLLSMIIGWRRTEETVRDIDRAEAAEFAKNAVAVLFFGRESW